MCIQVPDYLEDIDYFQLVVDIETQGEMVVGAISKTKREILDMYNFHKELGQFDNYGWYKWWISLMCTQLRKRKQRDEKEKFFALNDGKQKDNQKTFFVTIGIDPKINNIPLVVSVIDDLMANDWIKQSTWVYENYTEHGEKLHIMCKMELHEKIVKSVLIQKICRSKGLAKIVEMNQGRSSTYVSVLPFKPYHEDYINLVKTDKKTELLDKDETFRKKYNLKLKYCTIV